MSKGARVVATMLMPIVGRFLTRTFVAGWSKEEALAKARVFISDGYAVSLNNLVEHVTSAVVVEQNVKEALALIALMRTEGIAANLAIKPSSLGGVAALCGTSFNSILFCKNLVCILDALRIAPRSVELEIDAEGYATCDHVFDVVCALRQTHTEGSRLRLALQMHDLGVGQKLHEANRAQLSLRIVKGAPVYAEATVLSELSEKEIERRARAVFRVCMERGTTVPYGAVMWSRDTALAYHKTGEFYRREGGPQEYKIQMLYGVGGKLTHELHAQGVPVAIYMAYLPDWAKREEAMDYIARRVESGIDLLLRKVTHWF